MTRSDSDPQHAGPASRQRIARVMARAGLCSRREAEAWILDGRVSLNGQPLTTPAIDVSPDDTVLVDGHPLPAAEKTRLFLFHKPRGLVTTDHDPEGRTTVADFLREHWPEGPRVVTVGRLDINTEGLLLLTNDGGLARVLELPQTGWARRYRVRAKGTADPAQLDALADGVTIDGISYAGIEAKLDRVQGANTWLTMSLREGKNREIKRVLEHLGLEVNRLIRLSFGPFQLADLPEGVVDEVRTRVLRDQLGPTLAAQAGVDFGESQPAAPAPKPSASVAPTGRPARDRPSRGSDRSNDRTSVPHDRRPRHEGRKRETEAPAPKRERPTAGARKHVATLRAERLETSRTGPRVRVERSDTRDRHDRVVEVERRQSARPAVPHGRSHEGARPARPSGPKRERSPDREARSRHARDEHRPADHRANQRRDGAATPDGSARHQKRSSSPSAAGKRERIARSAARPNEMRERGERRTAPSKSKTRQARPANDKPKASRARPDTGKPRRPPRRDGAKPAR